MNAISSRRVFVAPRRHVGGFGETGVMYASFLIFVIGMIVGVPVVWATGMFGYLGTLLLQAISLRDEVAEMPLPARTRAMVDAALNE